MADNAAAGAGKIADSRGKKAGRSLQGDDGGELPPEGG